MGQFSIPSLPSTVQCGTYCNPTLPLGVSLPPAPMSHGCGAVTEGLRTFYELPGSVHGFLEKRTLAVFSFVGVLVALCRSKSLGC